MTLPASAPITERRPGAPAPGHSHEGNLRLLGLLRDIRTDAEHIRRQLPGLELAARLEDRRARDTGLQAALKRLRSVVDEDGQAIEQRLAEARALLDADEALYNWGGDSVTEIENDWRDFPALLPPPTASDEPVDSGAALSVAKDGPTALDGIAYGVGLLTVSQRLNSQLEGVRVGGSLDFHAAFEDEISNPADRLRVLSWLASQPSAIEGVIDLAEGRVYRASSSRGRRAASYVGLAALAAVGGLLLCLGLANLGAWFGLTEWPFAPARFQEFLGAYLMLLLGGAAHILLDAIKQARGPGSGARFLAVGDWLLWMHVREMSIAAAIVSLWVGLAGLAVLESPISAVTAFFAGYSIDSVIDLFATRFDRFASGRLVELEKRLPS